MKIIDKIEQKSKNLFSGDIPTIAFLGDSVTQGCFEIYLNEEKKIQTVFDGEHAYHRYLSKIFGMLYPNAPVNIINAGISGGSIRKGYERLEKDVLRFSPDLVVVSFGLNDATDFEEGLPEYKEYLSKIYDKVQERGIELIFLTENMTNTYVKYDMNEAFKKTANLTMGMQNEGMLGKYFDAAKEVSKKYSVPVCDVYSKWLLLAKHGVDTTALLSNHINHPIRGMNWLFAYSLVETMMTN